MIPIAYNFEPELTASDFEKIGRLAARWAVIDHTIANCLKTQLRLSNEEAVIMVFPLQAEARVERLKMLFKEHPPHPPAAHALTELAPSVKGIQYVRNSVIHGIVIEDTKDGHLFHLKSKDRTVTKDQVFSTEDLTNYASHCALALRLSLGIDGYGPGTRYELPDRPEIPKFLRSIVQWPRTP